ncbi:hypothetical protein JCM10914A_40780 [Paenibacillus sp. JCM 10914]|uniref:hypothetical protein n=1 Tax=Paenibacillus sp. JCM 10914 TaxID=1236974 RepID=UPI0003CC39B9|nr:hypothetical protein [Paenibacillus sp. JCM 10914]GAE05289.1 hypothetical protein JCM10914_1385 [Paenibacillus sp. JCM 10914]
MKLKATKDLDKARYVFIQANRFFNRGCQVQEGRMYKIERNYANKLFVHGEAYIVDDEGKENESVFAVCSVRLYM